MICPRTTVWKLLGEKAQLLKQLFLVPCFDNALNTGPNCSKFRVQVGEVLVGGALTCRCGDGGRSLGLLQTQRERLDRRPVGAADGCALVGGEQGTQGH